MLFNSALLRTGDKPAWLNTISFTRNISAWLTTRTVHVLLSSSVMKFLAPENVVLAVSIQSKQASSSASFRNSEDKV